VKKLPLPQIAHMVGAIDRAEKALRNQFEPEPMLRAGVQDEYLQVKHALAALRKKMALLEETSQ
jgi:hypothetical protein